MILGIASPGGGRSEQPAFGLRLRMWIAHLAGGAIGGAVAGVGVWIVASPLRTLPPDVVVFVLFIGLAAFFIVWDLRKFDLPFQGRQVPATWIARYGAVRSYALYGAFLGAGVITFVPIGAIYVTFGAVALLVGIGSATIAGALYGVARAALVGPAAFVADASSRFLFRSQAAHEITRGSVPYYQ